MASGRGMEICWAILGDKFSVAWRVLDARYRLPQRRRRIYLVCDFGGFTAPKILFEQSRLFWDTAAGGGSGQGTPAEAESGADTSGGDSGNSRVTVFAANQRDEIRDLKEVAGALQAHPGMKRQTFVAGCLTPWDTQHNRIFTENGVSPTLSGADGGGGRRPGGLLLTAGFSAGASAKAATIGYAEEEAPTLKGSSGGNMVPSVLCVNDQGGERIDVAEDEAGTLRAQSKGHLPLVLATAQGGHAYRQTGAEIGEGYSPAITASAGMPGNNQPALFENNGADGRYNQMPNAPAITASYGTGGNNIPLIADGGDDYGGNDNSDIDEVSGESGETAGESYCIAGNTINREAENGGNGSGVQTELAYTVTSADRHAVYNRRGYSGFSDSSGAAATETAHQAKDATDLVVDVFKQTRYSRYDDTRKLATLKASGGTHGGGSENLVCDNTERAPHRRLIRRLTPLECERLQGFPDYWTDIGNPAQASGSGLRGQASDSARYKALGNSVAIPCVEFVMRGIAHYLKQIYDGTENVTYD
jgi:DNA (cytosine-5)-methyltransferase 1